MVALTLLTRPLVGALWGLVLVIVASAYGIRWSRDWWRNSGRWRLASDFLTAFMRDWLFIFPDKRLSDGFSFVPVIGGNAG